MYIYLFIYIIPPFGEGVSTSSTSSSRHDPVRVQGSGFRVQGARFRVQGSGFRVQGAGFKTSRPARRAARGTPLPALLADLV